MASYGTAKDQYVKIGDITFAYRRLGRSQGTPLLMINGFRGTMDNWDPALVDPLAESRPVLLIDNAGVGRSGGDVPKTYAGWVQHYMSVLEALGANRVDVLGYSMGGCIGQLLALNAPKLVRRLVLCGTIASTGEGVVFAPLGPFNQLKAAVTAEEHRAAFMQTFFTTSERGQTAAKESWDRILKSRPNRSPPVGQASSHRQAIAYAKFMDPKQAKDASYDRLHELKLPVLIANGNDDKLLPTANSILLWKKLAGANAQLHLYPDSGHGFLFQYGKEFAALINEFLDDGPGRSSRL